MRRKRRISAWAAVSVLLLTVALSAIPRPSAAQAFGGYADTLIFSVVPEGQALFALSNGDIDMYTGNLAGRDDPNIRFREAIAGFRGMVVNPVAPEDGSFNPFTLREVREALHWAYDRDFIVREIAGGRADPMWTPHFRGEAEYAREAGFFAALEASYDYNPTKAKAQVADAMSKVPGATFDRAHNQWRMDGVDIEVIIVQRVEDFRFEIGAYVATEVEALGFTPVLDPSTFQEALDKVYFADAKLGQWHLYTEGWGTTGWLQFADATADFFFNGDFGSAMWDDYAPPSALAMACQSLKDGVYVTLDERRRLLHTCVEEGMRDGVRNFLLVDSDVYGHHANLSNTVFDLFSGHLHPLAVRTTIKNGVPGGTLMVAQPVHTGSAWNLYGGFQDVYSLQQLYSITDFGTVTHPHRGVTIPFRTGILVNDFDPRHPREIPSSAMFFNVSSNMFEAFPAGRTSQAFVDFHMRFGEWHHGEMMSMDDVLAHIAMLSRLAWGDLATQNPCVCPPPPPGSWEASFQGFEILDADSIRIWYNTTDLDDSHIAKQADVFPWYPWELNALMAESVLAGETAFDDTTANLLDIVALDLAHGPTFGFLDPRLASNLANNTIPPFLTTWVTPPEAMARWAALNDWRNPAAGGCTDGPDVWTCNYMVSQGPYFLDKYFAQPEGAEYQAKRTGYPIEQDAWDYLSEVRVPRVSLGPPPEVIEGYPAVFRFTTSLNDAPYTRISIAAWFLLHPATKSILSSGEAAWTGTGTWQIELTAEQTSGLSGLYDPPYQLRIVVVGHEATVPVFSTQAFTILIVNGAIFADVTDVLDQALGEIEAEIDETIGAIEDGGSAAETATTLASAVLVLATAALAIAVVTVAYVIGRERKGS